MEFIYVYLLFVFVLLVTSLSLHLRIRKNKSGLPGPLPRGRFGWPIVGETLQFFFAGLGGHPEKFILDRMAKYSPSIFRSHLLGEPMAVFCGPSGNKFLFSNENKLVQTCWPISTEKILQCTPQTSLREQGVKMKKSLSGAFKPEALQHYIQIMDEMAHRLFTSDWDNKDQIEVFPSCKNYSFRIACKLFISLEDQTEIAKLSEQFIILLSGLFSIPIDFPGMPFSRSIKAASNMRKMLVDIIKQRKIDLAEGKATATQDFLSHLLLSTDEDGKFNHEIDIANNIIGLLIAGHDTLTSACGFIVKFLAELPDVYEGVYREQMEIAKRKVHGELLNWGDIQKMKYSWNVACESMRLFPPLQGSFREALTDFMYDGFNITKGWKLYWNAYSTHKNPEYFSEPEKFDPSRFEGKGPAPFTFVPFGGGPRSCTGREYSKIAILVFMHNLVKKFKFETLIPDEGVSVNVTPKLVKGLPVRLYPHKA